MGQEILPDTVELPAAKPRTMSSFLRTAAVRVDVEARTDRGKVRPNNEDNFHVVQFGRHLRTLRTSLPDGELPGEVEESGYGFLVADGMGGMAAGEIASRLAITLFVQLVLETPDWLLDLEGPHAQQVIDRAARRFSDVNEAVCEQADRTPELKGMGTTLSLALSFGTDLIIAHVGDSPVFLWRQGEFHRLTRDHTMGSELARRGVAAPSRFHHVLTHAIGLRGTGGEPDIRRYRLADGDRLLLCTDGLTNMVEDQAIAGELSREASADAMCQALVDLALARGGKDNVTAVVAVYHIP